MMIIKDIIKRNTQPEQLSKMVITNQHYRFNKNNFSMICFLIKLLVSNAQYNEVNQTHDDINQIREEWAEYMLSTVIQYDYHIYQLTIAYINFKCIYYIDI